MPNDGLSLEYVYGQVYDYRIMQDKNVCYVELMFTAELLLNVFYIIVN